MAERSSSASKKRMSWSWEEAREHLASLEPFGWRLGLERMNRLLSVLGMPQNRFASIHVVGTNGKSSVARIATALLEEGGTRAGAYLSPHAERWTERVLIGGREIEAKELAAAIERAAQGADVVNRSLSEGEAITQFELFTAAAFLALASAKAEVAAIEAGLGGRLDATNTIPSRASILTSVALEHTELLGESEEEIAAEKLAVLRKHTALILGEVSPAVDALAVRTAAERSASLIRPRPEEGVAALAGRGELVRRNFALARAAVELVIGQLEEEAFERAAARVELPGVLELREGDPPLVLDAAHNPAGARALADSLREVATGRPVYACLAMLEGKDAAGFVNELGSALAGAVCTEVEPERLRVIGRPGSRSLDAAMLAELCRSAGISGASAKPDPRDAIEHAREQARALDGVALLTGTHYLLPYGS